MRAFLLFLIPYFAMAADTKISDLPQHNQSDWATNDLFVMVDVSASKTKKTTVADLDQRYSIPALVGDVIGAITSNTVSTVGGKTAAAIATSVTDTQAATSSNISSTIVKRDSSGDITVRNLNATNISGSHGGFTASKVMVSNVSGVLTPSSTPSAQLTFIDNVTSDIQAQINAITGGFITAITVSAPLTTTGGQSPNLAITQSTTSTDGYLSSTDWNTFNNKEPAISSGLTSQYWRGDKTFQDFNTAARGAFSFTAPLSFNSGTGIVSMPQSSGSQDGYLSLGDWSTFNSKEPAITSGTTSQYWRGDKTFQDFNTSARNAISVVAPISYSSTTGILSMEKATTLVDGYLAATDFTTFNNKEPAISSGTTAQYWRGDKTFQDFNTSARAAISVVTPASYNSTTGVISILQSSASQSGYLSSTDWSTFNNKEPAITATTSADYYRGDKTFQNFNTAARGAFSFTAPLSYNVNTGVVSMPQSSSTQDGYLSSTDWSTFNGKQPAGNYLTALTNDVSASGPGSASATVNSVGGKSASAIAAAVGNVEVGSFPYTASSPSTWTSVVGSIPNSIKNALDLLIQKLSTMSSGGTGYGQGWVVNATVGGAGTTSAISSSAKSVYTEVTDSGLSIASYPGSVPVQIPCDASNPSTGATCNSGNEVIGVVFTQPATPSTCQVEVCVDFTHDIEYTSGSTAVGFDDAVWTVNETSNTDSTTITNDGNEHIYSTAQISRNASSISYQDFPMHICGIFPSNASVKRTFRLMYKKSAASNVGLATVVTDLSLGRNAHWRAKCTD